MHNTHHTPHWLGLALACGTLTFAVTTQAGKPVKPPPSPTTPPYATVALGGLRASDGSLNTFAADINNAGHVVGSTSVPGFDSGHYSQPFLLNPQDTNGDGQPDIWFVDEVQNTTGARGPDGQNDLIIGLGNLPGAIHGQAREVNDLGIVVGYSYYWNEATSEYRYQAFVVVPAGNSWHQDEDLDGVNDLMTGLGSLNGGGECSEAFSINPQGQIVGWCHFPGNSASYTGYLLTPAQDAQGAGRWFQDKGNGANALMVSLGAFYPNSINSRGQIVGRTSDGRAKLWNSGDSSPMDLGLAGTQSEGIAINERGQISVWWKVNDVGHAGLLTPLDANSDGTPDTWYRDANGDAVNDLVVDLGNLKGLENSYVRTQGLNNTGSVIGGSWHAGRDGLGWNRAAFLWQNGVLQSLKSLTGFEFGDAYAINDARQILAVAGGRDFNYDNGNACILLPTR